MPTKERYSETSSSGKKNCARNSLSFISTWHLLTFPCSILFFKELSHRLSIVAQKNIHAIITKLVRLLKEFKLITKELHQLAGNDELCLELCNDFLNSITLIS